MSAKFCAVLRGKISGSNVEDGLATVIAFLVEAISRTSIGDQNSGCEFGIGVELEIEFDYVIIFLLHAGFARTNHKAAVRKSCVLSQKFFFADEINNRVIIGEVIRHSFNRVLDFGGVGTFLKHNKAFAQMFLTRSEFGIFAATNSLKRTVNRHGVLFGIFDALNAADGVGVSLADAFAPESIIVAVGENCICIGADEREKSGIPADRDKCSGILA